MPAQPWATKEQIDLLESRLAEYRQLQPTKQYTHFWAQLFEAWFTQWPEELHLFPNKAKEEALTEEETEQLGVALKARRSQLQTWYRYRTSATKNKRAAMTSKRITTMETRTRLPTKEEIFSTLYYDDMIKPTVMARIQKENATSPGQKLNIIKSVRKDVFNSLSDEMLAQVEDALAQKAAEKESRKKGANDLTPEDYERAIEECPAVLRQFFDALTARTGWSFTVLMGGPDPRKNGNITSCSFHIGENRIGNNFNDAHPTFAETFMSPYTNFLETVYSKDIRQTRAHNGQTNTGTADNTESNSGSDLNSCDDETELDDVLSEHSNSMETGKLRETESAQNAAQPDASNRNDNFNSNSMESSFRNAQKAGQPDASSWQTNNDNFNSNSTESGLRNAQNAAQPDASNWQANNDNTANFSYHFPPTLISMTPNSGMDDNGSWAQMNNFGSLNNVGGDFMFNGNASWDKQSVSCLDMLYTPEYGGTGYTMSFGGAANTSPSPGNVLGQSLQNNADVQGQHSGYAMSFSSAANTSPGNELGQPQNDADQHDSTGLPFIPLPSESSPDQPHEEQSLPTSTSVEDISEGLLGTTSLSLQENSDTVPRSTNSFATKEASGPQNPSEKSSRFGRTIIPSTRVEKMNAIGSSTKENISPVVATPPSNEWVTLAKEHLLQLDLGEEWKSCVKAWLALEESLDYGAKTKGTLPLTKQRPEEWTKWASKARRGVQQYQVLPPIKDVELFGIMCMKWWHKIQPHFRQNGGKLLPLPNLTEAETSDGDPWINLRKGGPNGFVTVILLLSWWGQTAVSGTSSAKQWCDTTLDVQRVLQTMKMVAAADEISVQTKKRRKLN